MPVFIAGKYDQAVVEEEAIPLDRRVVAKAGESAAQVLVCCCGCAGSCSSLLQLCGQQRGCQPGVASWACRCRRVTPGSCCSCYVKPACSPPAGKMDAKKRLEGGVAQLMSANIVQCMGAMLDTVVF